MEFVTNFLSSLIFAWIIIGIYFGLLWIMVHHYIRQREDMLVSNNSLIVSRKKVMKIRDLILSLFCIAMFLYLIVEIGLVISNITDYYMALI